MPDITIDQVINEYQKEITRLTHELVLARAQLTAFTQPAETETK